jgi:uncharacterized membrane protein YbhN (UPF0104 family)
MSTTPRDRRAITTALASLAVVGLGGSLIVSLPWFLGVSWAAVVANLASVPLLALVGLSALWFAGLLVHVRVLMAAMPGLRARQALRLNLSGSAISNIVPVGGPAGMGLGYAMARSWGFTPEAFAAYTVTTNLWNALAKFMMGLGVLAAAALFGVGLPTGLGAIVLSASAFMALAAGVVALTFRTEQATLTAGRLLDRLHLALRPDGVSKAGSTWLLSARTELAACVRRGWKTMTAGVATYLVMQAALLMACLAAVGASATVPVVAVAFAIERLISLAPITPGAAGVAELGTVAALHFFGVDPVHGAAGVLLYRTLMFAVEIPIGGALAVHWVRSTRANRSVTPTGSLAPRASVDSRAAGSDLVTGAAA